MLLKTLQTYDLREFKGPIKLELGTYRNEPRIQDAQRKLYEKIQIDQVLWFSQSDPPTAGFGDHRLHTVDVDLRDVAAIIDTLIWCRITGYDQRYIPNEEEVALKVKAANSPGDLNENFRRLQDDYLGANLPVDLWAGVVKVSSNRKSDQFLVKFPLEHSVIQDVQAISEKMAKRTWSNRHSRSAKESQGGAA